jgi:ribonuclease T
VDLTLVSVDVEASGPSPAEHALLSIGACLVDDPAEGFYVELRPDRPGVDPAALAVSGLDLDSLAAEGTPAPEAMRAFVAWVDEVAGGTRPVFVALNAPFDWMFVAEALARHVGRNPLGHSALDLKALFMGVAGVSWRGTSLRHMAARYDLDVVLPHHALEDARLQARVARAILAEHARHVRGTGRP